MSSDNCLVVLIRIKSFHRNVNILLKDSNSFLIFLWMLKNTLIKVSSHWLKEKLFKAKTHIFVTVVIRKSKL